MVGEVEVRRRIGRAVAGAVAQIGRQRRRVHDLAGIEEAVGIERPLYLSERVVEHGAEHLLGERTAYQPVAVLAGQRAAELEHQIGDVVRDRFEPPDPFGGLEVDDRPHVQTADRRVRVDAGPRAMGGDDLQKAIDVVAQLFGRDRRVLDERQRLLVALHRHREAERGFAEAPDARLIRCGLGASPAAPKSRRGQLLLDGGEPRRQVLRVVVVELDAQERARLALQDAAAQPIERRALPRVIEDEAIHHLDRRRPVPQDGRRRLQGVEEIVELDREDCFRGWQRHERDRRRRDERQRALRSDDDLGQIERFGGGRVDELVQVVAADASQHLRETAIDLVAA